eukprot:TRINITY_DN10795_c0_g1_i1.p1 TRINITY_DN10795_c0_g1~~TRINITY_DN10795_c0_g1_i1.p1  ORF type:complete len:184 (+),score=41.27 TRINITY_DN10795_c0_g1_i1:49-600(+)
MRAVVQRVRSASVEVDGSIVSSIGPGMLVLVGINREDAKADADYLIRKLMSMRLWPNAEGKPWSGNVAEMNYEILLVSQFTLYGVLKGSKPDFHLAMGSESSRIFYQSFVDQVRATYEPSRVKDGVFGAMMNVALENDGPVTLILDSRDSKPTTSPATPKATPQSTPKTAKSDQTQAPQQESA